MIKKITVLLLAFFFLVSPKVVEAEEVSKYGIHILSTEEVYDAKELVKTDGRQDDWHYVTVPYLIEDLEKREKWEKFFREAHEQRLIPIVRLATKMEGDGWSIPNRKNVVEQLNMLGSYDWPTGKKHVIIFNEVNHAKEWGGAIDPEGYARLFRFASNWAHATDPEFVVMPAAMDLAAPNGNITMEAFTYLNRMHREDQEIFSYADAWNSHSYPNPGFSSAPGRNAKNALNGFEYELEFLEDKTAADLPVYITETGWEENWSNRRWLPSYYVYAMQHVWSHPQVMAVTPFILKGAPGPFTGFSFLTSDDKPTIQNKAFRSALEKLYEFPPVPLSAAE